MVNTLRQCSAAFFVLAGLLLLAPTPANAETFSLPKQLKHAGLSFPAPLTYTKATEKMTVATKIEFLKSNTVGIKEKRKKKTIVVEEIVVTPSTTTTAKSTQSKTLAVLPTPTIYIAPPAGTVKLPTPTPKLFTQKPTQTPTVAATQAPTTPPTVAATANVGGLDAEKLFNMSNAFRQQRGLPAFEKDARSCSLAASRAPEIAGEVASGALHSGLHARALPYWNTENIISMNSEEAAFNWWVNDPIHHDAIVGNYKYSCVACSGNNCAQEFTNFQPK